LTKRLHALGTDFRAPEAQVTKVRQSFEFLEPGVRHIDLAYRAERTAQIERLKARHLLEISEPSIAYCCVGKKQVLELRQACEVF
jgi:hypothetical protein